MRVVAGVDGRRGGWAVALATVDGKTGVFRIVEGRARFQPIETAGEIQGQIEVAKGLQGGETLISKPEGIRDGDKVEGGAPGA